MEQEARKLKFCKAAVVFIVYGVLAVLSNVRAIPYLRWFEISWMCLPVVYGIVLLAKNKTANIVIWVLAGAIPCIVNVISSVQWLGKENPLGVEYVQSAGMRVPMGQLIMGIIDLFIIIVLLAATIIMGRENSLWKPIKVFVLVAACMNVIIMSLQRILLMQAIFSHYEMDMGDSTYSLPNYAAIIWRVVIKVVYYVGVILYIKWAEKPYKGDK